MFVNDVRHAVRSLWKAPAFTGAAVLTLTLGIGANTAIFSAVNAVLLRPLPLGHPDQLLMVWESNAEEGSTNGLVSPANLFDWREQVDAFHDVAGYGTGLAAIAGEGPPEVVAGAWVTGNFFDVLGVPAAQGRQFRDEETWSGVPRVVMLSDRLWARRFGRDPAIIGRTVAVDETPREVVGIVPPGAEFPERGVDIWQPLGWDPGAREVGWFRRDRFLGAVARLDDGVSLQQARAQLQVVVERQRQQYPRANQFMGAGITPLQDFPAGEARTPLLILLGSTALLLLLTCANVGNLVLVRASAKGREVALRRALGAGRGRVVLQSFSENLVLALAGGLLGAGAGFLGIKGLLALQPPDAWRLEDAPIDLRLMGFAIVVTVVSAALFGLAPALRGAATDAAAALKEGARASAGQGTRRASQLLIIAEVALAVCLVTGAGLLLRSFIAVRGVDPGFQIEDRVAATVVLPSRYDTDAKILGFVDDVVTGLGRIPGVEAATYASRLPLSGTTTVGATLRVEGRAEAATGAPIGGRSVASNYFRVLGVPLVRGRAFDDADRAGRDPVVIINQEMMRSAFPNEDPIGRRITWDDPASPSATWYRIVGVVGDERQHGPRQAPQMEAFLPFRQLPSARPKFVLHSPGGPPVSAEDVRAAIAAADPMLPLSDFTTLEALYAAALGRDRFLLTLIGAFGVLALVLATVGVYGVTAEAAARRTQEIGIRVALGASSSHVTRIVLGQGLALAAIGILTGLTGAVAGGRVLSAVLYAVDPHDAVTFLGVAVVLTIATATACAIPARRAAKTDPMQALRHE
jgi:putative ABC transport system permease protein